MQKVYIIWHCGGYEPDTFIVCIAKKARAEQLKDQLNKYEAKYPQAYDFDDDEYIEAVEQWEAKHPLKGRLEFVPSQEDYFIQEVEIRNTLPPIKYDIDTPSPDTEE